MQRQNPGRPTRPPQTRASRPPREQKSYARAASAEAALNVQARRGKLYASGDDDDTSGYILHSGTAPKANGPPWLLAYVLLNGRSHELNEHFQLSVRDLDRASGTLIHFQDIGNPRIYGEIYQGLASDELLSRIEIEEDIYLQEVRRLGSEWNQRLVESEKLARALDLELSDLPCIAFRARPYDGAVPFAIQRGWYSTPAARWAFIDALREWLDDETEWLQYRTAPTTRELREKLCQHLTGLSHMIDQAVMALPLDTAIQQPASESHQFRRTDGTWEISFDGKTIHPPHLLGFRYLAILLQHPGRSIPAITMRNIESGFATCRPPDQPSDASGVLTTLDLEDETGSERRAPHDAATVDDTLDAKAIRAYKQRKRAADAELEEAEAKQNQARAEELREESKSLDAELARNLDIRGKSRRFSTEDLRACKSVQQAASRALLKIKEFHPSLHAHLRYSLTFGFHPTYRPSTTISWLS